MLNRSTEISQTDAQVQNNTQVTQKQKSQHGIHNIRRPILLDIPVETLTGITSYLSPPYLFALAAVDKYLNQHINDDNTWRRAFVYQFLGIGPESDLNDGNTFLLRRSERSWRAEFITRYRLRRRWERSRNVTTAHIPVHSIISGMHLMPSHALLTSSIEYGIVARSLPLTGKILSGYLDASGTRAGLGIGNPNAEFTPNVSACAIASDGGTAKIIWGSRVGDVLFMNAPKAMETSRRSAANIKKCGIADEHGGAVLDVKWADVQTGLALTGGADALVKLWDSKTASCVWTSQPVLKAFIPDACVKVAASIFHGYVIGVLKSGDIRVWAGFHFSQSTLSIDSVEETVVTNPIRTSIEGYDPDASHEIVSLHIDPSQQLPTFLVAYQNDPCFYRVQISPASRESRVTSFGDPFFGPTSIVIPIFCSENPSEHKKTSIVFVGDHLGCISLYAWDSAEPAQLQQPVRKFEAYPDGASITAIAWNGLTLISGSVRGTTRVFDGMTFDLLRSFPSPVPRMRGGRVPQLGDDSDEREIVRHILVGQEKDVLFVGVGDRVMAWRAGPVSKQIAGGVRGRHSSGVLEKKKRNAKYLEQMEMKQSILESRDLLNDQSDQRQRISGKERAHEQRARLDNLGLSEVEAVEYVLMLSRDEAIANTDIDEGVFEGDFDEGDTEADDELTTASISSRRPSTSSSDVFGPRPHSSSASSGSASPSSASTASLRRMQNRDGRPIPQLGPSSSNEKVQISPPYHPEPTEAGREYRSADEVGSPSPPIGTRMQLEDHYFPPISPTGSVGVGGNIIAGASLKSKSKMHGKRTKKDTKRTAAKSSSTPSGSPKSSGSGHASAWRSPLSEKVSTMQSNTQGPASSAPRGNVWAGPSRISPTPLRSSVHQPMHSITKPTLLDDDMDDDLRFALELSLVEARSRGENA